MKKIRISLLTCIALSSAIHADTTSLNEAFSNGKVSGEISAYTKSTNNSGATANSGYSNGSISLAYETASFNGVKGSLGFISNIKIDEEKSGDYGINTPKSVLNIANINYANDDFTLTIGKQAIDLEWVGDYHEAVVGVVKSIPNTTIILGHTQRINESANDGALEEYSKFNPDGASVLDVAYSIDKTTKLGAYYMSAPDLFSAMGIKAQTELSGLGIVGKYATTNENVAGTKDGSIIALDLSYNIAKIALNGGYITTDKDGGIGNISKLGDNINPLNSGNQVYGTDAKTLYFGASSSIAGIDLGLLYGTTSYDNSGTSKDESEINLTLKTDLAKNTNLSIIYSNINAEVSTSDSNYYKVQLTYSF